MIGMSVFMIILAIVSIVFFVIWIWAIVDIIKSDFKDSITKLVWLIVVIVFTFLGTILYLLFGKETKKKFTQNDI